MNSLFSRVTCLLTLRGVGDDSKVFETLNYWAKDASLPHSSSWSLKYQRIIFSVRLMGWCPRFWVPQGIHLCALGRQVVLQLLWEDWANGIKSQFIWMSRAWLNQVSFKNIDVFPLRRSSFEGINKNKIFYSWFWKWGSPQRNLTLPQQPSTTHSSSASVRVSVHFIFHAVSFNWLVLAQFYIVNHNCCAFMSGALSFFLLPLLRCSRASVGWRVVGGSKEMLFQPNIILHMNFGLERVLFSSLVWILWAIFPSRRIKVSESYYMTLGLEDQRNPRL